MSPIVCFVMHWFKFFVLNFILVDLPTLCQITVEKDKKNIVDSSGHRTQATWVAFRNYTN